MNHPLSNRWYVSRRTFLEHCALAAPCACGLVSLMPSRGLGESPTVPPEFDYVPVPDWTSVPKGMEMAGVNGIAVDGKGRVHAAGGTENAVLVFSPDGAFLGSWGKGTIVSKHELRIVKDRVYVADTKMHQMYEFTLEGRLLRAFGTRGVAGLGKNEFNQPTDIAFAPNGDIYITDGYGNSRVVCLAADGTYKHAWGSKGDGPGEFVYPHNIVIDAKSRVYVADRGNNRIQIFSPEGKFLAVWENVGKPYGLFLTPDEHLFVTDGHPDGPHRILVLNLQGEVLASFGSTGQQPGHFNVPHSLCVDSEKNLYVAEVENKRIQKFVRRG